MGWKHDMWAWTACVDTPAECLTLLWLNQRADDESGECFPSAEDIAAHTRLNRKTVFAAIKSLTEKGLIETKKRPGPGRRNLYRLCYERTENGTSQKWNVQEKVLSTSQKRDFQGAKNGTSNVPETVRETTTDSIKKLPESSMRTSGNSSAIAAVASAQAQTLPTSFPQSSNSQNHSETQTAGKDSLPNASERSVAAHRDRLDASDEQTLQNGTRRSQNASTCISVACPENEPPPMSDEDLENLFANAQLEECPPFPEKGVRPPFEKGEHPFSEKEEKGTHPSEQRTERPKKKRTSIARPDGVSEQVWNDFSALRNKRRAPITETALKGIQREAEKAGITLEEALSTCCERGWQGFKAEWYRREKLEQKNASKAEYQLPSNDDWDNFDTAHYA